MTLREKQVVSAYSGVLMCPMHDLCLYIEELLGRPVYTHELARKEIVDKIKEEAEAEFLQICEA